MQKLSLPVALTILAAVSAVAAPPEGEGWVSLFNGKDLSGWTLDRGKTPKPVPDTSDWKVVDGVIDYDAKDGKSLMTARPFKNYVLRIDWRLKTAKDIYGKEADENGKPIRHNPDSGVFLRGPGSDQANIWLNQMGSGEMWSMRHNKKLSPEVREKRYRPASRADKPHGEWNTFEITLIDRHVKIALNGTPIIDAPLPETFPLEGPIMLQHHGRYDKKTGKWGGGTSTVQFRNIYIRELPDGTQP